MRGLTSGGWTKPISAEINLTRQNDVGGNFYACRISLCVRVCVVGIALLLTCFVNVNCIAPGCARMAEQRASNGRPLVT